MDVESEPHVCPHCTEEATVLVIFEADPDYTEWWCQECYDLALESEEVGCVKCGITEEGVSCIHQDYQTA